MQPTDKKRWLGGLGPSKKLLRRGAIVFVSGWMTVCTYNVVRPLPEGTSVAGAYHAVNDIEFLSDLTFQRDGERVVEQEIFPRLFQMIDEAERFIVIDMFLFNDEHAGDREYLPLTGELTSRLTAKKAANPEIFVSFTTDEINTFYGAYQPAHLETLRAAGVDVVITDLTALRDSNAGYSAVWRAGFQWFGSGGGGFLPHPLTNRGQRVTARSYLRLFNMKANHRKLIVTEDACLVASANPHDASSFHSNIAWAASGAVCDDALESERGIAEFSGSSRPALAVNVPAATEVITGSAAQVRFLSEGKIRARLLEVIAEAGPSDAIDIAMFYLSDRDIVRGLLEAGERGAEVRLILDPNRDAFGREKGGIPNRQVAYELHRSGNVAVRWYDTHGEQFHTKLVVVRRGDETVMLGGSANLTRRNLDDLNLEADLEVVVPRGSPLDAEVADYFTRLWEDRDGHFTLPFDAYRDSSLLKRLVYRFQEWTGLASY
jgi:phosphatidylserine/phosphatidylglycerophosphate/cardiolipin synthase-like enzyme